MADKANRRSSGSNAKDEFLDRISKFGYGTREAMALLLGGVVVRARNIIVDENIGPDEIEQTIAFHDAAEDLWRDMVKSNPPISPEEAATRLRSLRESANDPVQGLVLQVNKALEKALTLVTVKDHR